MFGYLAVFGRQRWRQLPRAVALTIGLVLMMLTFPPLHNRYYGGPATETSRIMNVNRRALAISPGQLPGDLSGPGRSPAAVGAAAGILYLHPTRDANPARDRTSRPRCGGLQLLWVGTTIVALARRRLATGTKALLLVPLLYLGIHLLYAVNIYYPRHIVAGHLALGVSVLYALGRGWRTSPSRAADPVRRGELRPSDADAPLPSKWHVRSETRCFPTCWYATATKAGSAADLTTWRSGAGVTAVLVTPAEAVTFSATLLLQQEAPGLGNVEHVVLIGSDIELSLKRALEAVVLDCCGVVPGRHIVSDGLTPRCEIGDRV